MEGEVWVLRTAADARRGDRATEDRRDLVAAYMVFCNVRVVKGEGIKWLVDGKIKIYNSLVGTIRASESWESGKLLELSTGWVATGKLPPDSHFYTFTPFTPRSHP